MKVLVLLILVGEQKLSLAQAVSEAGDLIIGNEYINQYGGMTTFTKFYDFKTPIGHHVHLMEKTPN